MRFTCLIVFVLFFCFRSLAQQSVKQPHIPFWKTYSVKKIAKALTKDSCSDYEKAKRINDWIALNIKYDVKRYDRFNWKETTPGQTLWRRKAICSGYSLLFQALCKEVGVKAWVAAGYDKTPDYRNSQPYFFEEHAWNVFQSDSTYHLVDVTWGSGKVVRKMKIILLFNHPIYLRKRKFVRDYDADYFDSDEYWFAHTHLPLLPMWQLKTHVLSVERFEQHHFIPDSLSKNTFLFEQDIQSYDSKTKEDIWLYEGNKGHDFFERNNRTKGFHTYKYLVDYYNKYNLGKKNSTDKTRKKIANTYADTVITYVRKSNRDNIVRHRYVVDSIENRNSVIMPFNNTLFKEDMSNKNKIKWQIKGLQKQIKLKDRSIDDRHRLFGRISGGDLEKIPQSQSRKNADTLAKIINRMKVRYTANTEKIDSLNVCRKFWLDSVKIKMPELDGIHYSMRGVYDGCSEYINYNITLNKSMYPLYFIRKNQDSIVLIRKELKVLQDKYVAVQRYIFANYFTRQIDPINRASILLLKQNRALIKQIAKISKNNTVEKKIYLEENEKLYSQLAQTTKRTQIKIDIMEINIDWLNEYKAILKSELKLLTKEQIWQAAFDRFSTRLENKRHSYYLGSSKHMEKTSSKIKSVVR